MQAQKGEKCGIGVVGIQWRIAIHSCRLSFLPKVRPRRTGGRRPKWRNLAAADLLAIFGDFLSQVDVIQRAHEGQQLGFLFHS